MLPMTQPAKGQEPSMEEILASIRRIISDDDTAKSAAKQNVRSIGEAATATARPTTLSSRAMNSSRSLAAPRPAMPQEEIDEMLARLHAASMASERVNDTASDSLESTDQMFVPDEAPAPTARGHIVDAQSDEAFDDSPPEPPPAPASAPQRQPAETCADSGLMSAASQAAVDSAFNTLARAVPVQNGRSLEDLVREMLRPMLKTWLDDNLPSMVERLVRAEIERVSRARG
jgi:cell pole-organizing protein PopZ